VNDLNKDPRRYNGIVRHAWVGVETENMRKHKRAHKLITIIAYVIFIAFVLTFLITCFLKVQGKAQTLRAELQSNGAPQ
jgi:hypothetical protein